MDPSLSFSSCKTVRVIVDLKSEDLANILTMIYVIKLYSDSKQSYFTFATPEASKQLTHT